MTNSEIITGVALSVAFFVTACVWVLRWLFPVRLDEPFSRVEDLGDQ